MKRNSNENGFNGSLSDWAFQSREGDLNNAAFDKKDDKLIPKVGPCIGCTFNSATAVLFPNDESKPVCSNLSCYQNKNEAHIKQAINQALLEEDVLFVKSSGSDVVPAAVELIGDLNIPIYEIWKDCKTLSPPEPMLSKKEFIEEEYWTEEIPAKAEINKDYAAYKEDYQISKEEYQEQLESAQKALQIGGNDTGKWIDIILIKSTLPKTNAAIEALPKEEQAEAKKAKIEIREQRMQELDKVKIFKAILEEEDLVNSYLNNKTGLTDLEQKALCYILYSSVINWDDKKSYEKLVNIGDKTPIEIFKMFKRKKQESLHLPNLVRYAILHQLTKTQEPNFETRPESAFVYHIFKEAFDEQVEAIVANQNEIAKQRAERIKARLAKIE